MALDAGTPPVAHKFGPVADDVYITAILTAPADLQVATGGRTIVLHLPSGSTDARTPLPAGERLSLTLMRHGSILGSATAADPVLSVPKFNDFYYSSGILVGGNDKFH